MDIPDCNTPDCERGRIEGYKSYVARRALGSNPYDPNMELELYEGWVDGWAAAQRNDDT